MARTDVESPARMLALIAASDAMRSILAHLRVIAPSDGSVLLIGETGVGKELIAEFIHRQSKRCLQPFVRVSLSALPPDLLESELFGHERGAFTSASSQKAGLFEHANKGTIFLDDIDDFPMHLQSKLLRVLESREMMRVGSATPIPVNVRLITASKVDLYDMVERGQFRKDLYYRINVVPTHIPPLRDRREDIPALVEHFTRRFAPQRKITIEADALQALCAGDWPGNVRELRNVMQRVLLFVTDRITVDDLPAEVTGGGQAAFVARSCVRCFADADLSFEEMMGCLEKNLLEQALARSSGNQREAARLLKLSASTFRDKMKRHGLQPS